MTGTLKRWSAPALILAVNWFANFLYFTRMGLYEDDWYFVGFPFSVSVKQWMVDCFWNSLSNPAGSVGRPIQFVISTPLAQLGALTGSLSGDYLLAFANSAGASLMMLYLLRQRFSLVVSTLATLLFVISPLHTLHQFVIYQFAPATTFTMVFLAMLLYIRGRRVWPYVLAALSLMSYESIFCLFLAAPLMRRGRMFQGRRREWLVHLTLCAAMVALFFWFRAATAEARIGSLPPMRELIGLVTRSWAIHLAASFSAYYYGALRAWHDGTREGWIYAILFGLLVAAFCWRMGSSRMRAVTASILRPAFVGLAFLTLGYMLAYFIIPYGEPRLEFTDRPSRTSLAASFGSSVLVAVLLRGLMRRALVAGAAGAGVCILFLYAFVLQGDYVRDWAMQSATVRQFMALTPDVAEDSILVLRFPTVDPGLAGQPAIGADQDGFDEVIKHLHDRTQKLPTLFIVVSDDWPKYLRKTADGYFEWTAPSFPGRWYPSSGRYRAGRFIVLDEQQRGHMIRKNEPVLVEGVDVVQHAPESAPAVNVWATLRRTPLFEKLLGTR